METRHTWTSSLMAARRSKSRFIVIVALYEYLLLFALCTTSWWFSFKPHKYSTQSECKYTNIFEFSTVL